MKTLRVYRKQVSSDLDNINFIIEGVMLFFWRNVHELPEDSLFELRVVLNELIINAIKHGNKEDKTKFVNIAVGLTNKDYIFLIIEDQGEGYDYECLNEPCCKLNSMDFFDMKETGRGITIVKNLCDSIKVNQKGNKVIVLKKIHRINII